MWLLRRTRTGIARPDPSSPTLPWRNMSVRVWLAAAYAVAELALAPQLTAQAPAGATAQCRDGSYSFSASRRGTCSHHGGVSQWLTSSPAPTGAASTPAGQAPGQQPTLTAAEAKDHLGETATVCGVVASARYAASSRGRPTFLNLEAPYPNQLFTVVIWGSARNAFPTAPEEAYRAKRICVTGLIESYRSSPQIVVQGPAAIRVMSLEGPARYYDGR